MESVKDKFKIVETSVAALLKLEGFKKDGLTWRKEKKGVVQIINLQLSQWNTREELQFMVNVAVFEPDLFERKYGYKEKNPKEWQCSYKKRIRIEHLKNTRESFIITASTAAKELAARLMADIKVYALPWLEKN